MQTPMSTPPSSPTRGSPVKAVDLFGTPNIGTPKRIRYDESPERTCPCSPAAALQMPSPPKKKKGSKGSKAATLGLPILTKMLVFLGLLGKGSFGEVQQICFPPPPGSPCGTPCSPPIAVKIVKSGGKMTSKDLRKEAANLGSPGCASGVAMKGENETYYEFSSIATPLSQMLKIGAEMLESVIEMTKDAIMAAPIGVVYDCKPDNLGLVTKGTHKVTLDVDGQPCVGNATDKNEVVFIDIGDIDDPESADRNFNPLLDEEAMKKDGEELKFRQFKCDMMELLLRNQLAVVPSDEKIIVANLCKNYDYAYAAGTSCQEMMSSE